jgi:CBS domain-containing protein
MEGVHGHGKRRLPVHPRRRGGTGKPRRTASVPFPPPPPLFSGTGARSPALRDRQVGREGERRSRMKVEEIMQRHIPTARPDCTLQTAAGLLRDENIAELPVCDEHRVLVGLITDRDLAVRALARGIGPSAPLAEILPGSLFYCFEDQECRVARRMMEENQVPCLPVTDSRKRLVGMVRLADLDGDVDA